MNRPTLGVVFAAALAPLCALAASISASPDLANVMALPATAQEAAQLVPPFASEPPAKVTALNQRLRSTSQQLEASPKARVEVTASKAEADSKAVLGRRALQMEDLENLDDNAIMQAMTGLSLGVVEKMEGISDEEGGAFLAAQMNAGKLKNKPVPEPTLSASLAELQQVIVINRDLGIRLQAWLAKAQQLESEHQRLIGQYRTAEGVRQADGVEAKIASFKSEATVSLVAANGSTSQPLALGAIGSLNDATGELSVLAAKATHRRSELQKKTPTSSCG